jgi:indolepyruvate ferredoxin oxidoreductase
MHLGGIDAMVRLTLDQVRTDARRGLQAPGCSSPVTAVRRVGMLDAGA